MTHRQTIEYFRSIAINLKAISHIEQDGKRRFAVNYAAAIDGTRSKMSFNDFCMCLDISEIALTNNGEALHKNTDVSITIGKHCKPGEFETHEQAKSDAFQIFRSIYSRMMADRQLGIGPRYYDIDNIRIAYVKGDGVENMHGVRFDVTLEAPINYQVIAAEWYV